MEHRGMQWRVAGRTLHVGSKNFGDFSHRPYVACIANVCRFRVWQTPDITVSNFFVPFPFLLRVRPSVGGGVVFVKYLFNFKIQISEEYLFNFKYQF